MTLISYLYEDGNFTAEILSGNDYTGELNEVTNFFGGDLKELLELQLTTLGSNLTQQTHTLKK